MNVKYLYADQLSAFPTLAKTMFADRAIQFRERLGWDVTVDANGYERDEYDAMNPMYVIAEDDDGTHLCSMRIMPTIGSTMVNDHFRDLTGGVSIESPLIWECTRFCLSPKVKRDARRVAGAVMLAGCRLGLEFGLENAVGVFDARMVRVYSGIGWVPTVIGCRGEGREKICAGLWGFTDEIEAKIAEKSGLDRDLATAWFGAAFGKIGTAMPLTVAA